MISLPQAFQEQILKLLPEEGKDLLKAIYRDPKVSIRLNPRKKTVSVSEKQVPWCSIGRVLENRPKFTADPMLHAGGYYVQESSSMFLEHVWKQLVPGEVPLRVLDLCAAPGGKSSHLASMMQDDDLLVTNEVIRSRAHILSENIQKTGAPNVLVSNNDPSTLGQLEGFFDVIVVDAPCSGEGLFRREPDAMKEWSPDNVKLCSQRQQRILADIWPALKPDGLLIYSTCTFNEEENEQNLVWLRDQLDAELLEFDWHENWGVATSTVSGVPGAHFYPHKVEGEGLFIAAVRKVDGDEWSAPKKKKKSRIKVDKEQLSQAEVLFDYPDGIFVQQGDEIFVVPKAWEEFVTLLQGRLSILTLGIPLGQSIKGKWRPSPGLALTQEIRANFFERIEVDLSQALKFLSKDDVHFGGKQGWQLVCYEGFALGWLKCLGNRSNNYYPKEWRIRNSFTSEDFTPTVIKSNLQS